mgnify:CR=1 FL=1
MSKTEPQLSQAEIEAAMELAQLISETEPRLNDMDKFELAAALLALNAQRQELVEMVQELLGINPVDRVKGVYLNNRNKAFRLLKALGVEVEA